MCRFLDAGNEGIIHGETAGVQKAPRQEIAGVGHPAVQPARYGDLAAAREDFEAGNLEGRSWPDRWALKSGCGCWGERVSCEFGERICSGDASQFGAVTQARALPCGSRLEWRMSVR